MRITAAAFAASLNCPTKCFLYLHNEAGGKPEFPQWQARIQADFETAALERMCSAIPARDIFLGTPPLSDIRSRRYELVVGHEAVTPEIQSRLHALQVVEGKSGKREGYAPIRFVAREKLNASDRLRLAFDALAVSHDLAQVPHFGKLVHGRDHRTLKVHLDGWIRKVRRSLSVIREYQSPETPPPLILNRHCGECEFQERCRQLAVDQDNLSLITNLTEKEWKKQHDKGIFTVTQLSFTFRPRRRVNSLSGHQRHALKALAIRTNKIHVLGSVPCSTPVTPVYIDVEGDPDRDFYYLIGLRLSRDGRPYSTHSGRMIRCLKERSGRTAFASCALSKTQPSCTTEAMRPPFSRGCEIATATASRPSLKSYLRKRLTFCRLSMHMCTFQHTPTALRK
jgi:predicted RecB family nuclease